MHLYLFIEYPEHFVQFLLDSFLAEPSTSFFLCLTLIQHFTVDDAVSLLIYTNGQTALAVA